MAEHVAETLDRLGVTAPAHVVGSSPGGAVAMRLAVHDPARVTSPALADSAGIGREVTWMLRALDLPVLWRLLLRPDEYGARTTERSLFRHPAFATPYASRWPGNGPGDRTRQRRCAKWPVPSVR